MSSCHTAGMPRHPSIPDRPNSPRTGSARYRSGGSLTSSPDFQQYASYSASDAGGWQMPLNATVPCASSAARLGGDMRRCARARTIPPARRHSRCRCGLERLVGSQVAHLHRALPISRAQFRRIPDQKLAAGARRSSKRARSGLSYYRASHGLALISALAVLVQVVERARCLLPPVSSFAEIQMPA